MFQGTPVQRVDRVQSLADRLGPEILLVDDLRDGWPALCRVKVGEEWVRVALHVGPIGSSQRGRDESERRFQNPSQNKPISDPPGYRPMLIGLAYDERGEVVALAGMDAEKRLGRPTRFSMFIPSEGLAQASRSGWYEHRSSSGELLRIAHPALLPVIVALDEVPTPVAGIGPAIASEGIQLSAKGSVQEAEARRRALQVARSAVFEQDVRRAYDDQCALCHPGQRSAHVFVLERGELGGSPGLDEALPLCACHYDAFSRHQLYVDPASRIIRIGPGALTSPSGAAGHRAIIQSTREKLGAPADGHHAVGAEQLIRHYRQHEEQHAWAKQAERFEEPVPLVVKSALALGRTNPESRPVSAVTRPKMTDIQSEPMVPEQIEDADAGAQKHGTPNRRSDEAIESLQSLAGLLLTSNDAKRSLILRSRIMAADENSPVQELVVALVRRYGNQLTVRKLLDSQPESFVVDLFSKITWIGKNKAYRFVPPEDDPAEMREAVLCLTRLLLAHLAKGKAGVDSVAESSELLQPVAAPKTYEPPVAQCESSVAEMEEPVQTQPSAHSAIVEAVAMSSSGEVLVTIGDEMFSLPSKAAKLMDAQWQGWSAIAGDPDFDLSAAVALTPGLNQEVVQVVVSLLQNGSRLRFVELGAGPSLREVALYLSSLPTDVGSAASERLRAMFFDEQFANQETFLLGCLGALREE